MMIFFILDDTLKHTFAERSSQYRSFSSRKQMQIANAVNEGIQFTENASVALQQIILTHVHTKCPPLAKRYSVLQSTAVPSYLTR